MYEIEIYHLQYPGTCLIPPPIMTILIMCNGKTLMWRDYLKIQRERKIEVHQNCDLGIQIFRVDFQGC